MANQEILNYIRAEFAKGVSESNIKNALVEAGWELSNIQEAFDFMTGADKETAGVPTTASAKIPQSNGASVTNASAVSATPFSQPLASNSSNEQVDFSALPSPDKLLKAALGIFKERLGLFVKLSLISIVPLLISALLGGVAAVLVLAFNGFTSEKSNPLFMVMGIGVVFAILLAVIVFVVLQMIITIAFAKAGYDDTAPTVKETLKFGKGRFGAVLWTGFLDGLVVLVGFLLFVIPGIIFAYWFCLAQYVAMFEGLSGFAAMKRSKELVGGRFGYLFVSWLMVFVLYMIVFIPISFIGVTEDFQALEDIVGTIVSLILAPILTIYGILIYKAVKFSKQA